MLCDDILNVAPQIQGLYNSDSRACAIVNTHVAEPNILATAACDLILLTLMVVGLIRRRGAGRYSLWRILFRQVN